MTYYDSFDCKINCEEIAPVSDDEREEVFRLIAQESEAMQSLAAYLDGLEESERAAALEQLAFEASEAPRKAWKWNQPDEKDIRLGGMSI